MLLCIPEIGGFRARGKAFRVVRKRGVVVKWECTSDINYAADFPFSLLWRGVFPFPL